MSRTPASAVSCSLPPGFAFTARDGSSSRRARSAGRARHIPRSRRPRARRRPCRTRGSGAAARRRIAGRSRAAPPRTPRTSGAQRRNRDRMRPSLRGLSDAPPAANPPLSPPPDLSRGRPTGGRGLHRRPRPDPRLLDDARRPGRALHAAQPLRARRPARDPRRAGGSTGTGCSSCSTARGGGPSRDAEPAAVRHAGHDFGSRAPVVLLPDGGATATGTTAPTASGARWSCARHSSRARAHPRRRIAIGGISMGGYGALLLGSRGAGDFCAVGGHSPALWFSGADSAAGCFRRRRGLCAATTSSTARRATRAVWIDVGAERSVPNAADQLRARDPRVRAHV